jgi:8-oxo-dGTP pyrophosphatase MutT (NUDIX family)
MNPATDYKIIHRGVFHEEDFFVELIPDKKHYKASTRKLINQAWQDAKLNPNLDIFNGDIISLNSIMIAPNHSTGSNCIYLKVQTTDYKSFYGTNICNANILPKTELANALAACAVVENMEGTVFLGLRNERLAETSGVWHVPGGTFDTATNPISLMKRELEEELNIEPKDISQSICLGFGENLILKKPEFLCYFHVKLTEKQMIEKLNQAKDKDEHTEFVFVPIEDLHDFVDIHPVAPIGKAAIELYLDYINPNRM